jgi:hypothetical protein
MSHHVVAALKPHRMKYIRKPKAVTANKVYRTQNVKVTEGVVLVPSGWWVITENDTERKYVASPEEFEREYERAKDSES